MNRTDPRQDRMEKNSLSRLWAVVSGEPGVVSEFVRYLVKLDNSHPTITILKMAMAEKMDETIVNRGYKSSKNTRSSKTHTLKSTKYLFTVE